jgi:hypothetical protein
MNVQVGSMDLPSISIYVDRSAVTDGMAKTRAREPRTVNRFTRNFIETDMEANELENEAGASAAEYGLGVTLTLGTKKDLLPEFRLMKSAIVDWASKRGDKGILIVVNVIAKTDIHDIFDDLLAKVYAKGSKFARVLQRRTVQVTLLDLEGNECGQYEVEPPDAGWGPGE